MSPLRFLAVISRRICRNLADHEGRSGFSGRLPMGDSLHGGVAAVGTLSAALARGMLYFKEDPGEPAADYEITDEDAAMRRRFEEWMIKYGRRYKDKEEKALRYEAFKRNVNSTPETNAKGVDEATFGTNGLSDLTEEEWYPRCHGSDDIPVEVLLRHGVSKEELLRCGIIVDGKN